MSTVLVIDPRLIAGLQQLYQRIDTFACMPATSPVDRRLLLHHLADYVNGKAEAVLDEIETPLAKKEPRHVAENA